MDQVMDGGRLPLETWFWEMPICTRWWTVATILTSALVQCHMVTPFQLFYSFRAVFVKSQVRWVPLQTCSRHVIQRLLTNFVVLAAIDDVPLLWPLFARPSLSHILPTALCATPRRVFRTLSGSLFMASRLCHGQPHCTIASRLHAFPWSPTFLDSRIYLVASQPGD